MIRKAALWTGAAMFALSWFSPVVIDDHGVMPGWKAFWWAIGGPGFLAGFIPPSWAFVFTACSALSNVMVLIAIVLGARGTAAWSWWPARMVTLGILNAAWLLPFRGSLGALSIGYVFWWLSFFLVGYGCTRARVEPRLAPMNPAPRVRSARY